MYQLLNFRRGTYTCQRETLVRVDTVDVQLKLVDTLGTYGTILISVGVRCFHLSTRDP